MRFRRRKSHTETVSRHTATATRLATNEVMLLTNITRGTYTTASGQPVFSNDVRRVSYCQGLARDTKATLPPHLFDPHWPECPQRRLARTDAGPWVGGTILDLSQRSSVPANISSWRRHCCALS